MWMPAPCDRGASTREAPVSSSLGKRSQRWFMSTAPRWRCVNVAAFGLPVDPEVKKYQQGSSSSTVEATGPPAFTAVGRSPIQKTGRVTQGSLSAAKNAARDRPKMHAAGDTTEQMASTYALSRP